MEPRRMNPLTRTGLQRLNEISCSLNNEKLVDPENPENGHYKGVLSGGASVAIYKAASKNFKKKELKDKLKVLEDDYRKSDFDYYINFPRDEAIIRLQRTMGGIKRKQELSKYHEVKFRLGPILQFTRISNDTYLMQNARNLEVGKYEIVTAPPESIFAFKAIRDEDPYIDRHDMVRLVRMKVIEREKLKPATRDFNPKKAQKVIEKYDTIVNRLNK